MLKHKIMQGCLGLAAVTLLSASLPAWGVAGQFQFVIGQVKVVNPAGQELLVKKGDAVEQGDTIVSAPGATAQLRMTDGGLIVVRQDTRMKLAEYRFAGKADGTERSLISLLRGGFRTITGLIGRVHKESSKIETPTSTIGIRGTDHEPMYIPDPQPGETPLGEPGTYDKVNSGATVLSNSAGAVEIHPMQVGFAPNVPNVGPSLLSSLPSFYQGGGSSSGTGGHGDAGSLPPPPLPSNVGVAPPATTLQALPPSVIPQSQRQQTNCQPPACTPPVGASDRRLKKNIQRIGTHPLGIGIYRYEYIWGEPAVGVMADEVAKVKPEAVVKHPLGFDVVDYSKL